MMLMMLRRLKVFWSDPQSRSLSLVILASVLERADVAAVPAVFRELGQTFNVSPLALGFLKLVQLTTQAIVSPLAAYLVLRYRRTGVIAAGAGVSTIATFGIAISTTLPQIVACIALNSIGAAVTLPAILSLIADSTDETNRGTTFGCLHLTGHVGSFFGGITAVLLAGTSAMGVSGWRFAFLTMSGLSFLIAVSLRLFASNPPQIVQVNDPYLDATPFVISELEMGTQTLPQPEVYCNHSPEATSSRNARFERRIQTLPQPEAYSSNSLGATPSRNAGSEMRVQTLDPPQHQFKSISKSPHLDAAPRRTAGLDLEIETSEPSQVQRRNLLLQPIPHRAGRLEKRVQTSDRSQVCSSSSPLDATPGRTAGLETKIELSNSPQPEFELSNPPQFADSSDIPLDATIRNAGLESKTKTSALSQAGSNDLHLDFTPGWAGKPESKVAHSPWEDFRAIVEDARAVLRVPTFKIIVLQSLVASVAWSALSFSSMWLELTGFSHGQTATIGGIFIMAGSVGGLFGGFLGDRMCTRYPTAGRIMLGQFSTGIAFPLTTILLRVLPMAHCSAFLYGAVFFAMGCCMTWTAPATFYPIMAEIVPPKSRTNIYALEKALIGALGGFSPPLVGMMSEKLFGYEPVPRGVAGNVAHVLDERNAAALGKAMYAATGVPFLACCFLFVFLYGAYPQDRDVARYAQAAREEGELSEVQKCGEERNDDMKQSTCAEMGIRRERNESSTGTKDLERFGEGELTTMRSSM